MFSYPDTEKKLVVVDFVQGFKSQTLKNRMQKRQYWIQENNSWKIIYEGAAQAGCKAHTQLTGCLIS